MALIKCPNCGKDISDRVSVCPKCNFDMEAYYKKIEQEKLEEEKRKQLEEQKRQEEEERRKQEEARKEECPECGVLVDKDVENCPNCGFPIKEEKLKLAKEVAEKKAKRKKCFSIIIAISVVLFAMVLFAVQKNKASKYNKKNYVKKDGVESVSVNGRVEDNEEITELSEKEKKFLDGLKLNNNEYYISYCNLMDRIKYIGAHKDQIMEKYNQIKEKDDNNIFEKITLFDVQGELIYSLTPATSYLGYTDEIDHIEFNVSKDDLYKLITIFDELFGKNKKGRTYSEDAQDVLEDEKYEWNMEEHVCSIVAKNLKCNFSPEEWQYTVLIYRNKKYEQINSDFKYVTGGEELQKQKEENQNKKTNETQEEVYLKRKNLELV